MNEENKEKKYVVDENGVIVNTDLLNEEQQSNLFERIYAVDLPYRRKAIHPDMQGPKFFKGAKGKQPPQKAKLPKNEVITKKVKAHHQKTKVRIPDEQELRQDKLVKCPFCPHETEYNVLFVHLQVSHPEMNPKIVMAAYNRVYRNKNGEDITEYKFALDKLVNDYQDIKKINNPAIINKVNK